MLRLRLEKEKSGACANGLLISSSSGVAVALAAVSPLSALATQHNENVNDNDEDSVCRRPDPLLEDDLEAGGLNGPRHRTPRFWRSSCTPHRTDSGATNSNINSNSTCYTNDEAAATTAAALWRTETLKKCRFLALSRSLFRVAAFARTTANTSTINTYDDDDDESGK
jgi:hypothetical protein